jgi:hypothetical protein
MLTAATILETNGFELLKNHKQLTLMGFDVVERESGTSTGKTKISKGNSHIRRVLFMPAFVAVKHNENQQIYTIEPLKTWC